MIEFRIALMRAGLTLSDLAPRFNVSPRYLRYVMNGERRAQHIRDRLISEFGLPADAISLPPHHKCLPNRRPSEMKNMANLSKVSHA